ncbi:MAG: hypothetical protein IT376_23580 [Polyangiaceae bacterium]|nr:hypothetical protein [Polyangiaceae bacterium]
MKRWFRLAVIVTAVVLYASVGWVVGLVVLAVAVVLLVRRLHRARRALAPATTCPWCHTDVEQYGSFSCSNCRARTLGWAWRCSVCSAWAGHVECPSCGMSVTNPLLRGR